MYSTPWRHRVALALAACLVVAIGLDAHAVEGPVAAFAADSLYTVLVYLILRLIFVRAGLWMLAVAAFAFSAVIEVLQLSGLPEQWGDAFPPARLVLGTSFSATDLVSYAIGALAIWLADRAVLGVVETRSSRSARSRA
ncbi:DUF2809 domain-containing protein [Agreia bicolorata]|uniref:ribosomal maturation YjgA family protein n=1 Tax=Agreia bicolorata TaxID=110935 RepID=UPI0005C9B2F6|nr:DUF2809 domain-containing protein [Agreia bicolorata]